MRDKRGNVWGRGSRRLELTRKRDLYERHGVPEYWYVDLEAERIEVYQLAAGTYGTPTLLGTTDVLESPPLPDFSVALVDVFA